MRQEATDAGQGNVALSLIIFFSWGPSPPVYPHTPRLKNEKRKRQSVCALLLSPGTSSNGIGGRQDRGALRQGVLLQFCLLNVFVRPPPPTHPPIEMRPYIYISDTLHTMHARILTEHTDKPNKHIISHCHKYITK